jgi:hypothetical protein
MIMGRPVSPSPPSTVSSLPAHRELVTILPHDTLAQLLPTE